MKALIAALMILTALTLPASKAHAMGIEPKNLTFTLETPSQYITITNETPDEQTYSLKWQDGKNALVNYAPRRITVAPGESGYVRLLFRKPAKIKDGEYAARLLIVPEKNPEKFQMESPEQQAPAPAAEPILSFPVTVSIVSPPMYGPPAPTKEN